MGQSASVKSWLESDFMAAGNPSEQSGSRPKPVQAKGPGLCQQTLFVGKDPSGNLCDLYSAQFVPAYHLSTQRDGSHTCTQFCLPLQNSYALKTVLRANIGLCCMQGPGFNNFQGSLNEKVPGFMDLRAWQYSEGESDW